MARVESSSRTSQPNVALQSQASNYDADAPTRGKIELAPAPDHLAKKASQHVRF
jgi:hypothetical protein